ncbi:MAG: hypothetical protein NTY02_19335 [Acidobacteria bacterium]|nr:hypothetical protein [Acidobacteriota bacterium]
MRRFLFVLVAVLLAWAAWALVSLPPASLHLPAPVARAGDAPVVRGVYHIHSRASDGTGTLADIAAAASRAGLSFVIVTDHGDAMRRPSLPAYLGGVLCLEGVEISTTDGHYAALGLPPPPYPLGGEARDVVEDVARLGGFGVAAHPDSSKKELRWEAWDTPFDGVEWFNADSQWRDEQRWRLLPTILQYPIRPTETVVSLFDRPVGVLREWDRLTSHRRVVGLAAADAHARMGLGGKADPYDEFVHINLPSYESVFRAFSSAVELDTPLSGNAVDDAGRILRAIRAGHVYSAFTGVAGPPWLAFAATSGGITAHQGDTLPLKDAARIEARANVPPGGTLWLLRNGEPVQKSAGGTLQWDGRLPGAYRLEARLDGAPGSPPLPWIVTNPIYVGIDPGSAAPPPLPAATASLTLSARTWRIEKAPVSAGTFVTSVGQGAPGHEFRFQLGAHETSPFVAMVTSEVGPLTDATRMAFRARASRPLRLSVQVRSVDGSVPRRWQRSVYLDTTPRDVTVVFADMREAGTAARVPLEPARIDALLFVFDTTNARPGDGGTVWIEGLRTER